MNNKINRNNRQYEISGVKFVDNYISMNHSDNVQDIVGNFTPIAKVTPNIELNLNLPFKSDISCP